MIPHLVFSQGWTQELKTEYCKRHTAGWVRLIYDPGDLLEHVIMLFLQTPCEYVHLETCIYGKWQTFVLSTLCLSRSRWQYEEQLFRFSRCISKSMLHVAVGRTGVVTVSVSSMSYKCDCSLRANLGNQNITGQCRKVQSQFRKIILNATWCP